MPSKQKQAVLHPFVFGLYPVVFLYTANRERFDFSATFVPAIVAVLLAGLVWLGFKALLSDWDRAGAMTSAFLMATFSYSAVAGVFKAMAEGDEMTLWSKILGICLLAVAGAVIVAFRSPQFVGKINYVLNVVSIFLVAAPLFQTGLWNLSMASIAEALPDRTEFNATPRIDKNQQRPDIYYFVLDGYGREDFLKSEFGYDNSAMSASLKDRGFAVPAKAVANYPFTFVSVNSSLNFTYLQDIFGENFPAGGDQRYLRELMEDSRAVRLLKSAGYKVVTFEGEYWGAQLGGADYNFKEWWFRNIFDVGVVQMTPLPTILKALDIRLLENLHRTRTIYPFEHMHEAIEVAAPKFVYTHVFFGHPPFVFGKDGEPNLSAAEYVWDDGAKMLEDADGAREDYVTGYVDQMTYLNKRVLKMIDEIIEKSDRDPIIIMHGDHGAGSRYDQESLANTDIAERYHIFYAAHLPDGGNEDIYESMTPVNGLRIVFNRYFGTSYELLDDKSYFAKQSNPYEYEPVEGLQETSPESPAADLNLLSVR